MIWLTWRQLRSQSTVVVATAAVLAAALMLTAQGLRTAYSADVEIFLEQLQLQQLDRFLYLAGLVAAHAIGPIVGAFWGAPLVARELEAGTHRLAWNQSTTRFRWLAVKLLVIGGLAVVVTGLLSLVVTWWSSPVDRAIAAGHGSGMLFLPRMVPVVFGARGIVPVGYTVLGLAIGVTLGLLIRRTVPALGLTLALVAATQVLMPMFVRPHLVPPVTGNVAVTADNFFGNQARAGAPGDWSLQNRTIDGSGRVQETLPTWLSECIRSRLASPGTGKGKAELVTGDELNPCFDRLTAEGYRQQVKYQPARNFWSLQLREAALLLTLAALLLGFCFRRIGRDAS